MFYSETRILDRHSVDLVKFGSAALRDSFEALHSVVSSDRATLSRVTSGWPQIFLDMDEVRSHQPEEPRKRYSAAQISKATRVCQAYTEMPHFQMWEKRAALYHVQSDGSWRDTSRRFGQDWRECRRAHDSILVAFVYVIAAMEGIELAAITLAPRKSADARRQRAA